MHFPYSNKPEDSVIYKLCDVFSLYLHFGLHSIKQNNLHLIMPHALPACWALGFASFISSHSTCRKRERLQEYRRPLRLQQTQPNTFPIAKVLECQKTLGICGNSGLLPPVERTFFLPCRIFMCHPNNSKHGISQLRSSCSTSWIVSRRVLDVKKPKQTDDSNQ